MFRGGPLYYGGRARVQHGSWSKVWGSRMTTPHLTPKPRTPDQVWDFFNRKRDKPVSSKSSIWNCQIEPHGTVGVLTVPFSGRYVRDLESLKAMESHSLSRSLTSDGEARSPYLCEVAALYAYSVVPD